MADIHTTKGDALSGECIVICKICNKVVEDDDDIEFCPDCVSPFHKSCWDRRGGCGNPDCKSFVSKKETIGKATSRVAFAMREKANASLLAKDFESAKDFYSKSLMYEPSNKESLIGIIFAECSVSSKELAS